MVYSHVPYHCYIPLNRRYKDLSNSRTAAYPDIGKLRREGGGSVQVGVDGGKVHRRKDAVSKVHAKNFLFIVT